VPAAATHEVSFAALLSCWWTGLATVFACSLVLGGGACLPARLAELLLCLVDGLLGLLFQVGIDRVAGGIAARLDGG
jgi:hypothetical protein